MNWWYFPARENSRHFARPPLVSPQNDVWATTAEILYRRRVTTQIWVVLLIGRVAREICFNQSETLPTSWLWQVNSMEFLKSLVPVSQKSFRGETSVRPHVKVVFEHQKRRFSKRAVRVEIVENASFSFTSGQTKTDAFDHTAQGMLAYFHRFSFFVWTAKTIQIRYVWTLIPLKRRKRF